jgi:hypothetical protein
MRRKTLGGRRVGEKERAGTVMPVPTFDFDADTVLSAKTLFPDEIDQDSWVVYHATSSVAEPLIDEHGLPAKQYEVTAQALSQVISIFKSMNWAGQHGGGYAVLVGYSLNGDFSRGHSKPIYFREHSTLPLVYATREFAGGETVRGIRYAMQDLNQYLHDRNLQTTHYESQKSKCIDAVRNGCLPDRVVRVDVDWLSRQLKELQTVQQRCEELREQYSHGVVYAIKMTEVDLPFLSYDGGMGIRCWSNLSANRIVAKARILSRDFDQDATINDDARRKILGWRSVPDTLVHHLTNHRTASEKVGHKSPVDESLVPKIHPEAGVDESNAIAEQYGSPEVIGYLKHLAQGVG